MGRARRLLRPIGPLLTLAWCSCADEVDRGNIITGPRRKRAAAAAAMQSSEWTTMLSGKLDALADSDSDDD